MGWNEQYEKAHTARGWAWGIALAYYDTKERKFLLRGQLYKNDLGYTTYDRKQDAVNNLRLARKDLSPDVTFMDGAKIVKVRYAIRIDEKCVYAHDAPLDFGIVEHTHQTSSG